ncbi:hypothetical protein SY83_03155 [Paenibacillus swuensis]|uniref:Uncharacterized protein n=1 Tax=Paenibacillus swuensis TaxID=1178515 RepID=A0A172TEV4_9BACL|nr:hypothetical protein [Paenibacillus swuensis]ANE45482.1 hypothetical protein SY83_03155 [Paenibacillus swuensis]
MHRDNNINMLMDKFEHMNLPHHYSLSETNAILISKFKAVEKEKALFNELNNDPHVNFLAVHKCYSIEDNLVLDSLYSRDEKMMHAQFKSMLCDNKELLISDESKAINQGNIINIIIEGDMNNRISAFTVQGHCERLVDELTILKGISSYDVNSKTEIYRDYILLLNKFEYI